jgi:hypothetical protein
VLGSVDVIEQTLSVDHSAGSGDGDDDSQARRLCKRTFDAPSAKERRSADGRASLSVKQPSLRRAEDSDALPSRVCLSKASDSPAEYWIRADETVRAPGFRPRILEFDFRRGHAGAR